MIHVIAATRFQNFLLGASLISVATLLVGCKDKGLGLPCLVTPIPCETDAVCKQVGREGCNHSTGTCEDAEDRDEFQFTPDALECPSSVCIQMAAGRAANGEIVSPPPVCSQPCGGNSDCEDGNPQTCVTDESDTPGGYVCVTPLAIPGSQLGCEKLCICRYYAEANDLLGPDGGVVSPRACEE